MTYQHKYTFSSSISIRLEPQDKVIFYESAEDPVHLLLEVLLGHGDACHVPLQPREVGLVYIQRPNQGFLEGALRF